MEQSEYSLPQTHSRRKTPAKVFRTSIVVSIVFSVILHVLLLLLLGRMSLMPGMLPEAGTDEMQEELDWFVISDVRGEAVEDGAEGAKRHTVRPTSVSDDKLSNEPLKVKDIAVSSADGMAPVVEAPDLKIPEEELDKAFKTLALNGVDTGKDEKRDEPEIVSATIPKMSVPLPDTDALFDIPDVPDATLLPGGHDGLELKGTFVVSKPKLAPVMLPDTSIGTGWSVSYVKPAELDAGAAGFGLGGAYEGLMVRGGLDWATGRLTDGAGSGRAARRASAALGVKVRLGGGITFEIPDDDEEEGDEVPLEEPTMASDAAALSEVRLKEGGEAIELSETLEGYVNVEVKVMREDNGGGYYQVLISPNEKCTLLHDVAKDVLFIIDHSGSIQPGRLRQFKRMTQAALAYLNPEDRFNVVSFATTAEQAFKDYLPPTKVNVERARAYIGGLMCFGTTDVFGGIGPFVKRSNGDRTRPLIVFVMTDGQSTVALHRGEVTVDNKKSNAVLKAIVDSNPGNVSIFPFSAGKDTNRMLMDFMARLNCGMPMHAPDGGSFHSELSSFLRKHTSLMVRDFRYIAEGRISDNIYPRTLPHLYRNESLSIYGRFAPTDEEVVLTLLGYDSQGKLRNLVFKRRFIDCEEVEYDAMDSSAVSLKEQWIAQKALHLLAEWVVSYDPARTNTPAMKQRRRELNNLLATITAFSKYSELLQ